MMAAVRSRDTKPEVALRKYLHKQGFRFRLHVRSLPGSPDIVLPKHNLAIFVHGCFWHHHLGCRYASSPDANSDKWQVKFRENQERDSRSVASLAEAGWRVFVIWECGLKQKSFEQLNWLGDAMRNREVISVSWPVPSEVQPSGTSKN